MRRSSFVPLMLLTIGVLLSFGVAQEQPTPVQSESFTLKKFEGAELINKVEGKFTSYSVLVDVKDGSQTRRGTEQVEGSVNRFIYRVRGASAYEVIRNYEEQFTADGFTIRHKNDKEGYMLGGAFCSQKVRVCADGLFGTSFSANQQYVSASKVVDGVSLFAVVIVADERAAKNYTFESGAKMKVERDDTVVGVDVIRPKALQKKMVVENASFIESKLRESGKVDLYGIYFDFNKSNLKPESAKTIEEIAQVLRNDGALRLAVRGHTDNVGAAEYNLTLSRERAGAVASALVEKYAVQASRLVPEGRGASEPIASNDTEEGRAKNRRVELAKLS